MNGAADKTPDKASDRTGAKPAAGKEPKSAMTPREIVSELDRHIVGQRARSRPRTS